MKANTNPITNVESVKKKQKKLKFSGNDSLAIGALWSLGSIVHPCTLCIFTAGAFLVNGVKQKLAADKQKINI